MILQTRVRYEWLNIPGRNPSEGNARIMALTASTSLNCNLNRDEEAVLTSFARPLSD